MKAQEFE